MRIRANDGTYYRRCEGGDEAAIHAAMRANDSDPPAYTAVIDGLSAQIVTDYDTDYLVLSDSTRVLIAVEGNRVIGLAEAVIVGTVATVSAWAHPTQHPDRALDFAGDALGWLRNIGVTSATVRVHCTRLKEWAVDPIPEHPLGLPRDLTYELPPDNDT